MYDKFFENLEKYAPKEIWDYMMYMGSVGDICLYKHNWTRKYINIDSNGNFYYYGDDDKYHLTSKEYALLDVIS